MTLQLRGYSRLQTLSSVFIHKAGLLSGPRTSQTRGDCTTVEVGAGFGGGGGGGLFSASKMRRLIGGAGSGRKQKPQRRGDELGVKKFW